MVFKRNVFKQKLLLEVPKICINLPLKIQMISVETTKILTKECALDIIS